jgi:hypothetical protein
MICGAGIAVDDDPPVRFVISDAAAMVSALVVEGFGLLTPPGASMSSCRITQTSCADIFRFEGRPPSGVGGGGVTTMEFPRKMSVPVGR